jgi:hypothetical protein
MLKQIYAQAAVLAGLTVALGTPSAQAQVSLYNSDGFQTRFVPGLTLEGQDALMGPWQQTASTSTAVVQSGVGVGGGIGVTMTSVPSTPSTQWFVSKPAAMTAPLDKVEVKWDMRVTANTNALTYGPFFGVEIYDASVNPSLPKQVGGFGVDASTGELLKLINVGGTGYYDTLPYSVSLGFYYSFSVVADYATDTYSMYINGSFVGSEAFVDPSATAFTDASLSTQFVSFPGEIGLNSGTAYFDNYSISLVPEPAMLSLAGLAVVGLLKRRR